MKPILTKDFDKHLRKVIRDEIKKSKQIPLDKLERWIKDYINSSYVNLEDISGCKLILQKIGNVKKKNERCL